MAMKAIMFGSIGTIAETSEIQRRAFNLAFNQFGLDWKWERDAYREMLARSGGEDRIRAYADRRGETVDAAAIHRRKTEEFHRLLAMEQPTSRPGVATTIDRASRAGIALAFVTTTSRAIVDHLLRQVDGGRFAEAFVFLGHSGLVDNGKPEPDIYQLALKELGVDAEEAVAIEDSETGHAAATGAGIASIAFPGEMHSHEAFANAAKRVDSLSPAQIGF